jgi:hypothetical protein
MNGAELAAASPQLPQDAPTEEGEICKPADGSRTPEADKLDDLPSPRFRFECPICESHISEGGVRPGPPSKRLGKRRARSPSVEKPKNAEEPQPDRSYIKYKTIYTDPVDGGILYDTHAYEETVSMKQTTVMCASQSSTPSRCLRPPSTFRFGIGLDVCQRRLKEIQNLHCGTRWSCVRQQLCARSSVLTNSIRVLI